MELTVNYVVDAHTHTLASGHAYCTMKEMTQAAKQKGLELLAITDHAPAMPGSCHAFHFSNFRAIHRDGYDVPLMLGVELNILDENGTIDLDDTLMQEMDLAIASLHPPCIPFLSKELGTKAVIQCMKNPKISIIGHPDDGRYPLDYDLIAKAAKETNTLLEVNNTSLLPISYRPNARENYKLLLAACMKYNTHVVLNSDAHTDAEVGRHDMSFALLKEMSFPEHLVVNTSVEKFKSFIKA